MLILKRCCEVNPVIVRIQLKNFIALSFSTDTVQEEQDPDEFRTLKLVPEKQERVVKKNVTRFSMPPRAQEMPIDQDWPSVWPGQRTYHPNVVPLPIRQGFPLKKAAAPSRFANSELMKIPNFLHLTPPAIRRHCEVLKKFCTKWPKGLETEDDCTKHFPVQYSYSDYCYSSPTIREPMARIVNLKVKLPSLNLDEHARDKFLRLVGDRYDPKTGYISITADKCPLRKQNKEYADYLLTAVYSESWRVEPWEAEKTLEDMEYYDWDKNQSKTTLITIHAWPEVPTDTEAYSNIPHATEYKVAVEELLNNDENEDNLERYKQAVKSVLNVKSNLTVGTADS